MRDSRGAVRFEDDLPKGATLDDLTMAMAYLLIAEISEYLGKVATFQQLYGNEGT